MQTGFEINLQAEREIEVVGRICRSDGRGDSRKGGRDWRFVKLIIVLRSPPIPMRAQSRSLLTSLGFRNGLYEGFVLVRQPIARFLRICAWNAAHVQPGQPDVCRSRGTVLRFTRSFELLIRPPAMEMLAVLSPHRVALPFMTKP